MQKNRKRAALTAEDKLYKAVQALFILEARQLDMGNKEIREILELTALTSMQWQRRSTKP